MADKNKQENKKKQIKESKPAPIKSYVHINTFLQTAIPMFGLNKMQAQGFKSKMAGRHYQRDENVFVEELKKYLKV